MLDHQTNPPQQPARAVIVGAGGFVGGAISAVTGFAGRTAASAAVLIGGDTGAAVAGAAGVAAADLIALRCVALRGLAGGAAGDGATAAGAAAEGGAAAGVVATAAVCTGAAAGGTIAELVPGAGAFASGSPRYTMSCSSVIARPRGLCMSVLTVTKTIRPLRPVFCVTF